GSLAGQLDRADEAEPAAVHGLDVSRRAGGIAQRLAQIANAARQRRVAHDRVAPDRREQIVLRDQPMRMLHEMSQDGKRPGRELEALFPAPGALVLRFDPDRAGPSAGSRRTHAASSRPFEAAWTVPGVLNTRVGWPSRGDI